MRKYKKIYIKKYSEEIQKLIGARKGCWNTEKGQNWLKRLKKCKRLKFDSIFLKDESVVDKENQVKE